MVYVRVCAIGILRADPVSSSPDRHWLQLPRSIRAVIITSAIRVIAPRTVALTVVPISRLARLGVTRIDPLIATVARSSLCIKYAA
jgi:hypothetical protein